MGGRTSIFDLSRNIKICHIKGQVVKMDVKIGCNYNLKSSRHEKTCTEYLTLVNDPDPKKGWSLTPTVNNKKKLASLLKKFLDAKGDQTKAQKKAQKFADVANKIQTNIKFKYQFIDKTLKEARKALEDSSTETVTAEDLIILL